jgi:arsenate reductase
MDGRPRIVFLCTGNSCRSQMAEGLLRRRLGDRVDVASAGTRPAGLVHPFAIRAMAEIDVDISDHRPKTITGLGDAPIDLAITVCDDANQACPHFPGAREQIHVGFDDPAHALGPEDEVMAVFRRVRDEIATEVENLARRFEGDPA